jgi:phosphoribosylaminoimidazole-succinocarboxamide synthase
MDVLETKIEGLPAPIRGKVRDMYDLGDRMLMVATDRLSAFDVVLPNPIMDKGRVLTQISRFWFDTLATASPNHMISCEWAAIETALAESGVPNPGSYKDTLADRSMLVLKTQPFPVECVVRGYLAGSLWKEYVQAGGQNEAVVIHGISLPSGLHNSDKLPTPIFTPATKATSGHDENVGMAEARAMIGEVADTLASYSISVYQEAADYALMRGVIIADTKFEFGLRGDDIYLIDEVLTPDSSRFWAELTYSPGKPQLSFDKQFVRDYLESIDWNKQPPAPNLPEEVIEKTADKYREAYLRLSGKELTYK